MRASEFAHEVSKVIDNRGWVKGELFTTNGVCLLGGIFETTFYNQQLPGIDSMADTVKAKMTEMIRQSHPDTLVITAFNDTILKDKADAVTFMEKVAIGLEESGL